MATASTAEGHGGGNEGRTPSAWQAISDVAKVLDSNYRKHTPTRLRMLDMFLVFVFSTGVLQVCTGLLALLAMRCEVYGLEWMATPSSETPE